MCGDFAGAVQLQCVKKAYGLRKPHELWLRLAVKGLLFVVHSLVTSPPLGNDAFQAWNLLQSNTYFTEEETALQFSIITFF